MAAQAVAGNVDFGARRDLALDAVVPRSHVGDLAPRPASIEDFQRVGRRAVADGVVDEFGAAEADDILIRVCLALEQRTREAGRGVGFLIDDRPLRYEIGRLGFGEEGGVVVAINQCIFHILNGRAIVVVKKRFGRHLEIGIFQIVGNG